MLPSQLFGSLLSGQKHHSSASSKASQFNPSCTCLDGFVVSVLSCNCDQVQSCWPSKRSYALELRACLCFYCNCHSRRNREKQARASKSRAMTADEQLRGTSGAPKCPTSACINANTSTQSVSRKSMSAAQCCEQIFNCTAGGCLLLHCNFQAAGTHTHTHTTATATATTTQALLRHNKQIPRRRRRGRRDKSGARYFRSQSQPAKLARHTQTNEQL